MPDLIAIAAALSSLKAAKDIAEAMIGIRDTMAFQQKQIEFQSKLIDANNAAFAAQEERFAILERIRSLEKEIADLKEWETEKKNYELQAVATGAFARVLKKEMQSAEPIHWICTQCYDDGKRSVLQRSPHDPATYRCNRCQNLITVSAY